MKAIDLKRIEFKNVVIDVGWSKEDLLFHFYTYEKDLTTLDKRLDPLFKEIFNLDAEDKNKLIESKKDEIERIANKENIKDVLLYSRDLEAPNKLYKAYTNIYKDLPVKDVLDIKSWCYKLTSPDKMFLEKKVDLLFKKIENF